MEISKLNVTTGTTAETTAADAAQRDADTSTPALESSTTLLRAAIQDELLNFESNHGASEEERRSLFRCAAAFVASEDFILLLMLCVQAQCRVALSMRTAGAREPVLLCSRPHR